MKSNRIYICSTYDEAESTFKENITASDVTMKELFDIAQFGFGRQAANVDPASCPPRTSSVRHNFYFVVISETRKNREITAHAIYAKSESELSDK